MLLYEAALIPPDFPRMKLSQLQRELCMQKVRGGVVREENGASRQNVGELTFKSVLSFQCYFLLVCPSYKTWTSGELEAFYFGN